MKCPVCNVNLNMMDRQGIEVDYCPQCRGVWLDRGELDKLIERSAAPIAGPSHNAAPVHDAYPRDDRHHDDRRPHDDHRSHDSYGHGHKPHKKESFLGDMFDF